MIWQPIKLLKSACFVFLILGLPIHAHAAGSDAPAEATKEAQDSKQSEEAEVSGPSIARTTSSYAKLPEGKHQPWRLVRALQLVQDGIAAGKPGGLELYRRLLAKTSEWMLTQNRAVWQHERNLDAVAVYLLIGGNPEVGELAYTRSGLSYPQKLPLDAAISYANRDFATARELMAAIDHTALPASASAQFALAKSMIASSSDLATANKYLGEARRLAPGTLIEEASLRRALRISGETKNLDDFRMLSGIYFNRFRDSHYFSDYLKNFVFALVRMPDEEKMLAEFKDLISEFNEEQQIAITSYAARKAITSGQTQLAQWASQWALGRLDEQSKLHTRMQLYAVAAGIVEKELIWESMETFETITRGELDESHQKLFDAVTSLSERIGSQPMGVAQLKQIMSLEQQTYPEDEPVVEDASEFLNANDTVKRAQKLFSEMGTLLVEETQ